MAGIEMGAKRLIHGVTAIVLAATAAMVTAPAMKRTVTCHQAGVSRMTDLLSRLVDKLGLRLRIKASEVVAERLNGLNTWILDLAITQLAQSAFWHARKPGNLREARMLDLTKASQNWSEDFSMFHMPHSQPINGLRQPTHGPRFTAYSQIWVNAL